MPNNGFEILVVVVVSVVFVCWTIQAILDVIGRGKRR